MDQSKICQGVRSVHACLLVVGSGERLRKMAIVYMARTRNLGQQGQFFQFRKVIGRISDLGPDWLLSEWLGWSKDGIWR